VQLFEKLQGCVLWNQYGPSETHVITAFRLSGAPRSWPVLPPIGRPIANTRIYLFDPELHSVPLGVPGEICVAGPGVARGYLNRPELTAEKFISDPFGRRSGDRLYRTGDIARYQSDGTLEFIGRVDRQVKLRGYRVELSEIEAAAMAYPAVREIAVVAKEDERGGKRLVAYARCATEQPTTSSELRRFLRERLPEYLVPSAVVLVEDLPRTATGKLDRQALLERSDLWPELRARDVAPRTSLERVILAAWKEALHLDQIGIHDNFFDIGGHSLLLVEVQTKLEMVLQRDLPMVEMFKHPTVESLAIYFDPIP
jgi:acyl-CoA synthetase (AMP-forming)/AMP-acid ligase II